MTRVHEVVIDITDATSTDEVLERMVTTIEDLHGTVQVRLHGEPARGVVVREDDITSWSTDQLEIVLADRPAPPARAVPASPAAPVRPVPPAPALPAPSPHPVAVSPSTTAAHAAWQRARAALQDHAATEPAPLAEPDLHGLGRATLSSYLATLRTSPAMPDPALDREVARLEATSPPRRSRLRAVGRAAAILLTVTSAFGLIMVGDTAVERVLAVVALVVVAVVIGTTPRRAVRDEALEAARAEARAEFLRTMDHNVDLARDRHAALTALQDAGLPADPAELEALVEAARRAEAERSTREAWEQRHAELAVHLTEAALALRVALTGEGVTDTHDLEAAWARLQARVDRETHPVGAVVAAAGRPRTVHPHHPGSTVAREVWHARSPLHRSGGPV